MRPQALVGLLLLTSVASAHQIEIDSKAQTPAFACGERIEAQVIWKDLPAGDHDLEAIWRLPDGRAQEQTDHHFQGPIYSTRVWLDVHRPMFTIPWGPQGPANGRWRVEFYLDGRRIGSAPFEVQC